MPIDPILAQAEEYLRGLTAGGYVPQYRFVAAEDTSGEGSGPTTMYVRETTPWQRQTWGQGAWFASDPNEEDVTSQGLNTGQYPEWRAISEAEIAADPTMAQDYDTWQRHLGIMGTRQEPFNLFTSDIFPALAAIGLSTGLAGAMGGFGTAGAGAAGGSSAYPLAEGAAGPALLAAGDVTGPILAGGGAAGGIGAGATGAAAAGAGGAMGSLGFWGPIISAGIQGGTSLLGGLLGSQAAGNAAETQGQAAREANALLAAIYGQQRQDIEPWRQAGISALGQLDILGTLPMPNMNYNAAAPLNPDPYAFPLEPYAFNSSPYAWNAGSPATPYTSTGIPQPGAGTSQSTFSVSPTAGSPSLAAKAGSGTLAASDPWGARNLGWNPSAWEGVSQQAMDAAYTPSPAANGMRVSSAGTPTPATDPYAFRSPVGVLSPASYAFEPPTGAELLAQDPGYQFRLEQGRQALEASAAARGGLLSGSTGQALAQYGQDLASQEYANAYQRALAENQLAYQRALQENTDIYGRALGENELAYGRGLTANQLGYNRALAENQMAFERAWQGNQTGYNRALQQNQDTYERQLQEYLLNYNRQMGQRQQRWNELSGLAGTGQTAAQQLAALGGAYGGQSAGNITSAGAAQAAGQMGSANAWMQALGGIGGAANSYLGNAMLQQQLGQQNALWQQLLQRRA
jgi:hypothetical protein